MTNNYYHTCLKCKKKFHVKSGSICPHCGTHIQPPDLTSPPPRDTTVRIIKEEKNIKEESENGKNESEKLLRQTNKNLSIIIVILVVTLLIPFLYFSVIFFQDKHNQKLIEKANTDYLNAKNILSQLEEFDSSYVNYFSAEYSNFVEKLNRGPNVKRDLNFQGGISADYDINTGDLTLNIKIPTKKSQIQNFVGLLKLFVKESNPVHKESYCFSLDGSVCDEKNLIPAKIEYSKDNQAFLTQIRIANFPAEHIENLNLNFNLRPPLFNVQGEIIMYRQYMRMALENLIKAQNR